MGGQWHQTSRKQIFYRKGNGNHELGTGSFVHNRIISAVKRVEIYFKLQMGFYLVAVFSLLADLLQVLYYLIKVHITNTENVFTNIMSQ
jgi:hypothetical protein